MCVAESQFFMSPSDTYHFVTYLIDSVSAEFVPERSFEPPPFPRFKTLAQVEDWVAQDGHNSRFFVVSKHWERLPLIFTEVNAKDGRHFYYVAPRYGGPAFDFMFSRSLNESALSWILPGWLSDYPYYITDDAFVKDYSLYRTFDRPTEMSGAHNEVRKYLRKNGCRSACREDGHGGPWILPGALKEYEAGTWLRVGDWHFEPKQRLKGCGLPDKK
jgi:hypothetical protein